MFNNLRKFLLGEVSRNKQSLNSCFCSLVLAFVISLGCINIARADVCFLPDGKDCEMVPYEEYGGTPNYPRNCFATKEEAMSARTDSMDSYYQSGSMWCVKSSCSGYNVASMKPGGWNCQSCNDSKSKNYNKYKCSCNLEGATPRSGYTIDLERCEENPNACPSNSTTNCVPDECHKCERADEDNPIYSGSEECLVYNTVEAHCPDGYVPDEPAGGCYSTQDMLCGEGKCYKATETPECGEGKRLAKADGVCSCVCKNGYHDDNNGSCVLNQCATGVAENTCDTAHGYTFAANNTLFTNTNGETVRCGSCEKSCEIRTCSAVNIPANAHCASSCTPQNEDCSTGAEVCSSWDCDSGYTKSGNECVCGIGYVEMGNSCIRQCEYDYLQYTYNNGQYHYLGRPSHICEFEEPMHNCYGITIIDADPYDVKDENGDDVYPDFDGPIENFGEECELCEWQDTVEDNEFEFCPHNYNIPDYLKTKAECTSAADRVFHPRGKAWLKNGNKWEKQQYGDCFYYNSIQSHEKYYSYKKGSTSYCLKGFYYNIPDTDEYVNTAKDKCEDLITSLGGGTCTEGAEGIGDETFDLYVCSGYDIDINAGKFSERISYGNKFYKSKSTCNQYCYAKKDNKMECDKVSTFGSDLYYGAEYWACEVTAGQMTESGYIKEGKYKCGLTESDCKEICDTWAGTCSKVSTWDGLLPEITTRDNTIYYFGNDGKCYKDGETCKDNNNGVSCTRVNWHYVHDNCYGNTIFE